MISRQVRPCEVLDEDVLAAMTDIPREEFVEESLAMLAYADTELAIGYGQHMLKPVLEGRLLQALRPGKTEKVLEIGTGSGYFTALLASLAGHVISVEIYPELSQLASQRLQQLGIENVDLQVGDASKSWSLSDRIDAIMLTAAVVTVPESYLHALKIGGRLLAVVGEAPVMSVQLITRSSEWGWETQTLFETLIPPMISTRPKAEFKF